MENRIREIVERMKALEQELEAELDKTRADFRYRLEDRKVRFEHEILEQQQRFKENLLRYIVTAKPRHLATVPFIYAVFIPMLLLDIFATLYQIICFPIYGIPRIRRRDYMIHDRNSLGYLNLLEKFNCLYCSYADGLASYLREIIGRTEQYWCPIKHARQMLATHSRYGHFAEFGDAEGYRKDLEKIRSDFEH